jgi:signal recognition particle receptor subunit beta/CheY-like chemotaxis protein
MAKVMVVADAYSKVKLMEGVLKSAGFEVVCFLDDDQLEERMVQEQPDVLLLDIVMPNRNGYEILRSLKRDERTKRPSSLSARRTRRATGSGGSARILPLRRSARGESASRSAGCRRPRVPRPSSSWRVPIRAGRRSRACRSSGRPGGSAGPEDAMAVINYAQKAINFKVVYYGPGLAGKTANLQHIHNSLPEGSKGKMISLAAGDDRTLFFDFLPVSALTVRGFTAKFQLYTVPGQVYYNMTRKLVLRGADGMVFVADSQWDRLRENVESFRNLEENLREYNTSLDEMPYVIQYNKRDLGNIAPLEYMEFLLNRRARRVPSFEAMAVNGDGVFDTLNTVSRMVLVGEFGQEKGEPRETA